MSTIEFYQPDSIPEDVLQFWRERQRVQDRFMALTAGPEWFAMLAADRSGATVAAVRDSSGTCRAVLPLLPVTWSFDFRFLGRCWHRHPVAALRVCGGDLIEDGIAPADLGPVWCALRQQCPALGGIWFDHVGSEERSGKIRASCGRRFFAHPAFAALPHYRLRLPPTVEEFRRLRSPESLKKIHGRERALARAAGAECRLVEIRSPADWAPYSQRIMDLMDHTWQSRRLGHQFNLSSLSDVAGRGWLRSFLLMAGETAAAFAFCFQGYGVLVYEQIGYDPRFSKFSPGTILLYRMLERLYEADTPFDGTQGRPECVDFGEGEAEYKNLLANDVIRADGLMIVPRAPALVLLSAAVRALNLIEAPLKKLRRR